MGILVQKFGGTSLSTPVAREHVVRHVKRELASGFSLVVVVSAMGRKGEPYATDTLLDLAAQSGNALPARERDLLMCCGRSSRRRICAACWSRRGFVRLC